MEILELQELPKDHLSWTQINMFRRCGKQYEFRYVEGRKIPPAGALILGTATHITLETDLKQKIDTKINIPTDQVMEIMACTWENTIEKAIDNFGKVDWEDDNPGKLKDLGISALANYHQKEAVKIQPEVDGVERKETLTFKNSPLQVVMSLDCLETDSIIDFKTGKRSMKNPPLPDQLALYSIKVPKPKLREDKLVHTIGPKYQIDIWEGEIIQARQKALLEDIANITIAIRTGRFYRNPGFNEINCGFCGYRNLCKRWG